MSIPKSAAALGLWAVLAFAAIAEESKKQPTEFTAVNKAKDIWLISDRDESIPDYFHRRRIMVCGMVPDELDKVLSAKETLTKVLVSYASQNDDPQKASTYGAIIDIAVPTEAVAKIVAANRKNSHFFSLILCRDEKNAGLYHLIGYTDRTPVCFFDNDEKNDADGFSQKELLFKDEPTK